MNKLKTIVGFILVFATHLIPAQVVFAEQFQADSTASLAMHTYAYIKDDRPKRLHDFLEAYKSPLADEAHNFVTQADKWDIDWKLVAAISGVESTFGQFIPSHSYNAWGWGIPTGSSSGIVFADWKEGIASVSEGLRKNYINSGATTIESIGSIYAASPTWSYRVRFFLTKIDEYAPSTSDAIQIVL